MKTVLIVGGVVVVGYLLLVLWNWRTQKTIDRLWAEHWARVIPPDQIAYFDKKGNRVR